MGSWEENDNWGAAGSRNGDAVRAACARLRARRDALGGGAAVAARAEMALARVWETGQARLASGWEPPTHGGDAAAAPFPWAQVRVSLAGLVDVALSEAPPAFSPTPLPPARSTLPPPAWSTLTPLPPLSQAKEGEPDKDLLAIVQSLTNSDSPSFACERGGRGVRVDRAGGRGVGENEQGGGERRKGEKGERVEEAGGAGAGDAALVALILAGNTPLLAWPALCAALLGGKAVFVKMSRNETLWAPLFWETLRDADADLAGLVHLDVWPGDDARTATLLAASDIVIAYGGDGALASLRTHAAPNAPFYGFGHAVSVGVVLADADLDAAAHGFARDVLMYDQGGCLSPQVVFVEEGETRGRAWAFAERLAAAFPAAADALQVTPSPDAGRARAVRHARQMALFTPGVRVLGDSQLRWTVLAHRDAKPAGEPTGFGVIPVLPVGSVVTDLGDALGALRGFVSSAGVAGTVTDELREVFANAGATRICGPGEMQAPPLNWRNNGVDLFAALRER